MKLKDSNISCIFVHSGFPESRSVFYVPVKESNEAEVNEEEITNDNQDEDEDFVDTENVEEVIEIEGKVGKYKASKTMTDRYLNRPNKLERMTLAQFAISYTVSYGKMPNKIKMLNDGDDGMISEEVSCNLDIYQTSESLPLWIKLKNGLGRMRLRQKQIVLRYHLSKKKEGHEEHYSEMLLFSPWRDEVKELYRYSAEDCVLEYQRRLETISAIKETIFPGEGAIAPYDFDLLEENRPQHVYDTINCQGEQQNEDDAEVAVEDFLEIAPLEWNGETEDEKEKKKNIADHEDAKYKKLELLEHYDLMEQTLRLVPEQKDVLTVVLNLCKSIVKGRYQLDLPVQQELRLIHGGAGKSFIYLEAYDVHLIRDCNFLFSD